MKVTCGGFALRILLLVKMIFCLGNCTMIALDVQDLFVINIVNEIPVILCRVKGTADAPCGVYH